MSKRKPAILVHPIVGGLSVNAQSKAAIWNPPDKLKIVQRRLDTGLRQSQVDDLCPELSGVQSAMCGTRLKRTSLFYRMIPYWRGFAGTATASCWSIVIEPTQNVGPEIILLGGYRSSTILRRFYLHKLAFAVRILERMHLDRRKPHQRVFMTLVDPASNLAVQKAKLMGAVPLRESKVISANQLPRGLMRAAKTLAGHPKHDVRDLFYVFEANRIQPKLDQMHIDLKAKVALVPSRQGGHRIQLEYEGLYALNKCA